MTTKLPKLIDEISKGPVQPLGDEVIGFHQLKQSVLAATKLNSYFISRNEVGSIVSGRQQRSILVLVIGY